MSPDQPSNQLPKLTGLIEHLASSNHRLKNVGRCVHRCSLSVDAIPPEKFLGAQHRGSTEVGQKAVQVGPIGGSSTEADAA